MTQQRRHILLIDRRFQFSLIGALLAIQLVLLAAAIGVLWLFLDSEMGATLASAHVTAASVRALLGPVLATIAAANAVVMVGATFAVVLVASHRIAGPLYRVREVLASVERGDLAPHTATRQRDQVSALAGQLTATLRQLADDISLAQQGLDAAAVGFEVAGQTAPSKVQEARLQLARYQLKRGVADEASRLAREEA